MSSGSMVQVGSEEEENIIAKYRLMHFAVYFVMLRSVSYGHLHAVWGIRDGLTRDDFETS